MGSPNLLIGIGPTWKNNSEEDCKKLGKSLHSCLSKAESLNFPIVAMSPYPFPDEISAKATFSALYEKFGMKKESMITKIILIVSDSSTFSIFEKELLRLKVEQEHRKTASTSGISKYNAKTLSLIHI
eukprot:TRINITY_DN7317_c0_g1_i2.p1 TRINITY_DN7317_c0_g1~~TRINITY_DN7317_c0_g1_i2.p1  ORF type:complete len:128 (-),score=11.89 TRINITY_DN7317_c0_g1_i2:61-444(-)